MRLITNPNVLSHLPENSKNEKLQNKQNNFEFAVVFISVLKKLLPLHLSPASFFPHLVFLMSRPSHYPRSLPPSVPPPLPSVTLGILLCLVFMVGLQIGLHVEVHHSESTLAAVLFDGGVGGGNGGHMSLTLGPSQYRFTWYLYRHLI